MGEAAEVVPPLTISPRDPGSRSKGRWPGRPQPEPRAGRRASDELPAIARRRRPSPPPARGVPARVAAPSGLGRLHLTLGFVQPTGVRFRLPWLPSLLVVLGLLAVWMAPPAAAAPPAPRVEARTAVVMDAATGAVLWQRQADRKSTRLNSSHITISYAV